MNLILAAPSDKYQGLGDNVSSNWTMLQLLIHWLSHVIFWKLLHVLDDTLIFVM